MNDQAAGDMPWLQEPAAPAPARQPRQQRKPREAAAPKPEKAPRKRRAATVGEMDKEAAAAKKPRAAKAKADPDTVKVTLKEYAETRVTAFQREFIKLYKILAPLPHKVRGQIIAELGKVLI